MLSIVIIVVFFCKDGANEWKVSLPAIYRLQFISCKDKDIGLLCKKYLIKCVLGCHILTKCGVPMACKNNPGVQSGSNSNASMSFIPGMPR